MRIASAGIGVVLLASMALAQYQIIEEDLGRPRLYTAQMPDLLSLRQQIPPGSRVTYTSDPRIDTVTNGLASYMLDHTTMLGSAQTGYSAPWSNGEPDDIGEFGLLSFQEDPALLGFSSEGRIWQGGSFVLYRKAEDVKAHLPLNRTLQPGESLTLSVGENDLFDGEVNLRGGEQRQVKFSIASFAPGLVGIATFAPGSVSRDSDITMAFDSGGTTVTTPAFNTPRKLSLTNDHIAPVTVSASTLVEVGESERGGVRQNPGTVLAHVESSSQGNTATTKVDAQVPNIGPVILELDIWDTPRGLHYGSYAVEQPREDVRRSFTLTLDLLSGGVMSMDEKGSPLPLGTTFEGLKPGDYVARLNIKAGTRLLATSDDIFTFSVGEDGTISHITPREALTLATAADRPLVPLNDTTIGDDVKLLGYALGDREVEPGEKLSVTLWWMVDAGGLDERSILLHLRDMKGEKKAQGDGPPANGGRPTSTWQEGEVIIDHHTIEVQPDTSDGSYNLAVGMYHFPSLEQLPVTQDGRTLEGSVLLIPVEVKR